MFARGEKKNAKTHLFYPASEVMATAVTSPAGEATRENSLAALATAALLRATDSSCLPLRQARTCTRTMCAATVLGRHIPSAKGPGGKAVRLPSATRTAEGPAEERTM
eukprot:Rhum_TRINITY_DN13548_c1_g1::Rhum_TRINITY_DN13548_c1_g1_i1::g.61465::m.61465